MDHQELHNALDWLRKAIAVGEAALRQELPDDAREEWMLALEKKLDLLERLEALNQDLLSPPAGEDIPSDAPSEPPLAA